MFPFIVGSANVTALCGKTQELLFSWFTKFRPLHFQDRLHLSTDANIQQRLAYYWIRPEGKTHRSPNDGIPAAVVSVGESLCFHTRTY